MAVEKVISGGQTGADQGALAGAARAGVATGGCAPRGYRTENGAEPLLKEIYGLEEHHSAEYPPRTAKNVRDSDGTALFGKVTSPGTRLTIDYCQAMKKPWIVPDTPSELALWCENHNIRVLNVAGNRESKHPGLQASVADFIFDALTTKEEEDGRDTESRE